MTILNYKYFLIIIHPNVFVRLHEPIIIYGKIFFVCASHARKPNLINMRAPTARERTGSFLYYGVESFPIPMEGEGRRQGAATADGVIIISRKRNHDDEGPER